MSRKVKCSGERSRMTGKVVGFVLVAALLGVDAAPATAQKRGRVGSSVNVRRPMMVSRQHDVQQMIDELTKAGFARSDAIRLVGQDGFAGSSDPNQVRDRITRFVEAIVTMQQFGVEGDVTEDLKNELIENNSPETLERINRSATAHGLGLPDNSRRAGLDARGMVQVVAELNQLGSQDTQHSPGAWDQIRRNGRNKFLVRHIARKKGWDKHVADNMSPEDLLAIIAGCQSAGAADKACQTAVKGFDNQKGGGGGGDVNQFLREDMGWFVPDENNNQESFDDPDDQGQPAGPGDPDDEGWDDFDSDDEGWVDFEDNDKYYTEVTANPDGTTTVNHYLDNPDGEDTLVHSETLHPDPNNPGTLLDSNNQPSDVTDPTPGEYATTYDPETDSYYWETSDQQAANDSNNNSGQNSTPGPPGGGNDNGNDNSGDDDNGNDNSGGNDNGNDNSGDDGSDEDDSGDDDTDDDGTGDDGTTNDDTGGDDEDDVELSPGGPDTLTPDQMRALLEWRLAQEEEDFQRYGQSRSDPHFGSIDPGPDHTDGGFDNPVLDLARIYDQDPIDLRPIIVTVDGGLPTVDELLEDQRVNYADPNQGAIDFGPDHVEEDPAGAGGSDPRVTQRVEDARGGGGAEEDPSVGGGEGTTEFDPITVFAIFDADEDIDLATRLTAQADYPQSNFTLAGISLADDPKERQIGAMHGQIAAADTVVVLCGADTSVSLNVAIELQMALDEGKPILLLEGWGRGRSTSPPLAGDSLMYEWTYFGLYDLLEAMIATD